MLTDTNASDTVLSTALLDAQAKKDARNAKARAQRAAKAAAKAAEAAAPAPVATVPVMPVFRVSGLHKTVLALGVAVALVGWTTPIVTDADIVAAGAEVATWKSVTDESRGKAIEATAANFARGRLLAERGVTEEAVKAVLWTKDPAVLANVLPIENVVPVPVPEKAPVEAATTTPAPAASGFIVAASEELRMMGGAALKTLAAAGDANATAEIARRVHNAQLKAVPAPVPAAKAPKAPKAAKPAKTPKAPKAPEQVASVGKPTIDVVGLAERLHNLGWTPAQVTHAVERTVAAAS